MIEGDVIGGALPNYNGIQISSSNNQIGGPGPLDQNVIAGNESDGISIGNGVDDSVIEGNVIRATRPTVSGWETTPMTT